MTTTATEATLYKLLKMFADQPHISSAYIMLKIDNQGVPRFSLTYMGKEDTSEKFLFTNKKLEEACQLIAQSIQEFQNKLEAEISQLQADVEKKQADLEFLKQLSNP